MSKRKKEEELIKLSQIKFDKEDITYPLILKILKKNELERTIEEKAALKYYIIELTNLSILFFEEHIPKNFFEKIIIHSIPLINYKTILDSNTLLYNSNDEAENLYIIIKGQIQLEKLEKKSVLFSGLEYYNFLLKLNENVDEKIILQKTIEENKNFFPLDFDNISILKKIVLKAFLISHQNNNPDYLDIILEKTGYEYSDFGLESYSKYLEKLKEEEKNNNFEKISENNNISNKIKYSLKDAIYHAHQNEKKILKNLEDINNKMCKSLLNFINDEQKFKIFYYQYSIDKIVKENEYFGDYKNDKYIHRAKTIINDTKIIYINNTIYKNFIKKERKKLIENDIDFLYSNFFFKSIKKAKFEKEYFNLFEIENYKKNEFIFKENSKVDFIYFIQKGEVKLTSKKSILQNHELIKKICIILKKNIQEYSYELNKKKLSYMEENLNFQYESQLFIFNNKICLGLESLYFEFNYLYNAIVDSEDLILYKINIKKLIFILKNNIDCYKKFLKNSYYMLEFFFNRIIIINKSKLGIENRKVLRKNIIINLEENDNINNKNIINNKDKIFNNKYINVKKLNLPTIKKIKRETTKKKTLNSNSDLNIFQINNSNSSNKLINIHSDYNSENNNNNDNKENNKKKLEKNNDNNNKNNLKKNFSMIFSYEDKLLKDFKKSYKEAISYIFSSGKNTLVNYFDKSSIEEENIFITNKLKKNNSSNISMIKQSEKEDKKIIKQNLFLNEKLKFYFFDNNINDKTKTDRINEKRNFFNHESKIIYSPRLLNLKNFKNSLIKREKNNFYKKLIQEKLESL